MAIKLGTWLASTNHLQAARFATKLDRAASQARQFGFALADPNYIAGSVRRRAARAHNNLSYEID